MEKKKFYEMTPEERIAYLKSLGVSDSTLKMLNEKLSLEKANLIIENVISTISLPLAVVPNVKINGKFYHIPMALEEPSVVAGFSKAAKMTLPNGFEARADKSIMIGQIQLKAHKNSLDKIEEYKNDIEGYAKRLMKPMEKYGGGFEGFSYRMQPTFRGEFLIVELLLNVADAQGANTINTVCEELGHYMQDLGIGEYRVRILSNLAVYRKAYAKAHWSFEQIEKDAKRKGFDGEEAIERFLDGYAFAHSDVFRLTTNNKGIMNGIDAVALATGQDFRALEAAAHMYSAIKGFLPLAHYWKAEDGGIIGEIEIPIQVGIVGGATRVLPHAKFSLSLLGVSSARELAQICAVVGLGNNFAAVYALSTQGINKGHMKLHLRNLAIMAGATVEEVNRLVKMFEGKKITFDAVKKALEELRKQKS